ncbi:MAG: AMP-binding protein [Clostridia bacterium]|nr:AMP-binding protein [Clostridia bacterium]
MEPIYRVREFSTIRELMEMSARLFGDRPAFEIKRGDAHFEVSYHAYLADINALSTALIDRGGPAVRAGICADNCYEYCLTYISAICAGGVVVPIDKELHTQDILGIIDTAEVQLLFCDEKFLNKHGAAMPASVQLICFRAEVPAQGERFDDFLAAGKRLNETGNALYQQVRHDPEALCTLLFTSGTTGVSKGVMLCQRNFVFEVKAAMGVIKIYPEDCGISLLPLHHTFESSIMLFFAPYCGAKVTFCEGFTHVLRNMKEFNPTVFVAVPQVLEIVHKRILKAIKKKKYGEVKFKVGKALCKGASKVNIDLKRVVFKEIQETFGGHMRLIICGGAPIDPQIIKDFDAFGIQVVFGYGLTECAPLAIINHDRLRTTDSIGQPLPGVQAKIIDKDENGIGEVCVKGDMVMLGYYNNPAATAEVMDADGFFHTGDLGFVDAKGNYHLTGRCKNVIVTSNGKNIYPEELEYHINASDVVAASMVEGLEDKNGEVRVHAQLLPDLDELEEKIGRKPSQEEINRAMKDVVDQVNAQLPGFKHIRTFAVRSKEFVTTTTQKIKRESNKS